MGYRSDGGIVLYGDKELLLNELIRLGASRTNDEPWNGDLNVRLFEDGPETLTYAVEYYGWKYDTIFPEVAELERIFKEASEKLNGYKWRLGEATEDFEIEHKGEAGYEECSVVVSVEHKYQDRIIDSEKNTFHELSSTIMAVS